MCNSHNFKFIKQSGLQLFLKREFERKYNKNLNPDECIIDSTNKILYIIEKKFQQCSGSVDEKIQTGYVKSLMYKKLYPTYTIEYMYVLSDWFAHKKYKLDLDINTKLGVSHVFGSDPDYKTIILDWISPIVLDDN